MAITREEKSNSRLMQLFAPALVGADQANIAAIDVSGFESVLVIANIGAAGDDLDQNNYIEIELEESDDNANFTHCSDESMQDAVAGTNTGTIAHLEAIDGAGISVLAAYKGRGRYIRPVIRMTGNHDTGTIIGVSAILRGAKYRPVAA